MQHSSAEYEEKAVNLVKKIDGSDIMTNLKLAATAQTYATLSLMAIIRETNHKEE